MAQRNDLVEKVKVTWDGEELPGLVSISEQKYSMGEVEVPEFARKRKMPNGVIEFADLTLKYAINSKVSKTVAFFQNFFFGQETHTLMRIRVDASGTEFGRTLSQDCQMLDYTEPEVDLANPTYAAMTVVVCVWESQPIAAEA
jgi:hypothetical protein